MLLTSDIFKNPKQQVLESIYGKNNPDNRQLKLESWTLLKEMPKSWEYFPKSDIKKLNILVIGNSHSKDIYNAIVQTPKLLEKINILRQHIQIGGPKERLINLVQSELFKGADIILISTKYITPKVEMEMTLSLRQQLEIEENDLKRLPWFIDTLKKTGKRIVLLSNTVEFNDINGVPIFDFWITSKKTFQKSDLVHLKQLFFENINPDIPNLNKELMEFSQNNQLIYIDKTDFICNIKKKTCDGITDEGYKSFFDYGHYTLEGAKYFGKKIQKSGWLDPLFEK